MTFLKALHWFNPLFRLAADRLAAAGELACDQGVLARLHGRENQSYGATIVKLLEPLAPPAPLPGLLGIAEDKRRLFERITAIRDFRTSTKVSLAAMVGIALVAVFGLTDAQPRDDGQNSPPIHRSPPITVSLSRSNAPVKCFQSDFAYGFKYHLILPDGALWQWDTRRQNPTNATPTLERVGTDTDWVGLWGNGTAVGCTADGIIWTWGGAVLARPVLPAKPSAVRLAYGRLRHFLGLKPPPFIQIQPSPFQPWPYLNVKDPIPIMRLVQTPPR